ncbi:MAG: hypothetical protein FWG55_06210 [Candidatus Bathyarchaeota archaeon]|nr:hypothetical protein [Candidatus Termiticorpusculum sp.]
MSTDHQKTELKVSYDKDNLEKLYKAKVLFEQDSSHIVEMDVFLDMLVEAFLSYRSIRGVTESQLLKKIASKNTDSTFNTKP